MYKNRYFVKKKIKNVVNSYNYNIGIQPYSNFPYKLVLDSLSRKDYWYLVF